VPDSAAAYHPKFPWKNTDCANMSANDVIL
jgi:hypothetical protein